MRQIEVIIVDDIAQCASCVITPEHPKVVAFIECQSHERVQMVGGCVTELINHYVNIFKLPRRKMTHSIQRFQADGTEAIDSDTPLLAEKDGRDAHRIIFTLKSVRIQLTLNCTLSTAERALMLLAGINRFSSSTFAASDPNDCNDAIDRKAMMLRILGVKWRMSFCF